MQPIRYLITGTLLAVVLSMQLVQASESEVSYTLVKNIPYYGESAGDAYMQQQCRLDVYHPVGVEDFATVVWFHAGGLKQGSRYVPGELMQKGFAVVAVDYRLSPKVKAPAYIEDAAAAAAWVFRNIGHYGGSTNRIVVAGASAGGYLSTMIGLDKCWLAAHGVDADCLAGMVSLSGQTITHVAVREEQGIKRDQPVIDELAPLYHVRADAPPLLIVSGDRNLELLGRYEENAYLVRMIKIAGHTDTELHELEGFDHRGLERQAHPLLVKFMHRLASE